MLADGLRYAGVGFQFLAEAGLLAGGGYWLDQRLGTRPFGIAVGAMLGVAYATYSMVRQLGRIEAKAAASEDDPDRGGKAR